MLSMQANSCAMYALYTQMAVVLGIDVMHASQQLRNVCAVYMAVVLGIDVMHASQQLRNVYAV